MLTTDGFRLDGWVAPIVGACLFLASPVGGPGGRICQRHSHVSAGEVTASAKPRSEGDTTLHDRRSERFACPPLPDAGSPRRRVAMLGLLAAGLVRPFRAAAQPASGPPVSGPPASGQAASPALVPRSLADVPAGTILGRSVFDQAGEDVGLLVDVIVDKDGKPLAGVIDAGGFLGVGTRRVAVAWRLLRFVHEKDGTSIVMDLTFDAATAAPEYRDSDHSLIVIDRPPP